MKIENQKKMMDKNRDFEVKYFLHIDQKTGKISSLYPFHLLILSTLTCQSNAFASSKCHFYRLKVLLSQGKSGIFVNQFRLNCLTIPAILSSMSV